MSGDIGKILASVGAKGVAEKGGSSAAAYYLILADENGKLDSSWLNGITPVGTSLHKTFYVDPIEGDDANDGGAGAPLATIAEGLSRVNDNLLFILSPGVYPAVSIGQASQTNVVFMSRSSAAQMANFSGAITFNNGQLGNTITVSGLSVPSITTAVPGGSLNVVANQGASVTSATSLDTGTAMSYPGSTIGSVVGLTRVNVVNAATVDYVMTQPTDWTTAPELVRDALDELAARTTSIVGAALIAANNLSDVADADTALTNIGGLKDVANIGSDGVSLVKGKNGLNSEVKKLNALSAKIVFTDNVPEDRIDVDISVTKSDVGLSNVENILNNFSATVPPGVSNDSSEGYSAGSTWIDAAGAKTYTCIVPTVGAAVWKEAGSGGHVITSGASTFTQRNNLEYNEDHFDIEDDAGEDHTKVNLKTTAFAQSFTTFNLFAGYLIVDHLLGERVVSVTLADNNFKMREAKVSFDTDDRFVVDMRGVAVVGTWFIKAIRAGGAGSGNSSSGGGDGLTASDRVSLEYTVQAADIAAGFFTMPAAAKFMDKVNIYAYGIRQKNALTTGVTNPDFEILNYDTVIINANGAPTVPLTGDIIEGDELVIVLDI